MKILGVLGIGIGCCLGMLDALSRLTHDGSASASFAYLNSLALAFQIDGLSAFFLLAIFAVCLLAAIYSFHYMNNTEKALGTATNYFFFSLLATLHGPGGGRRQHDHLSCCPGKSCPSPLFSW
jgi:hydrogenase-4 component B